jgi:hypothetical protein
MKRPHAEQAIAWFSDDEMVMLRKSDHFGWLVDYKQEWLEDVEYFTCHRSHLPAVLELLKGGEAEYRPVGSEFGWYSCNLNEPIEWNSRWWYMSSNFESRVKPKKQTRYAYVHKNGYIGDSFSSKDDLASYFGRAVEDERVITFEVEL